MARSLSLLRAHLTAMTLSARRRAKREWDADDQLYARSDDPEKRIGEAIKYH